MVMMAMRRRLGVDMAYREKRGFIKRTRIVIILHAEHSDLRDIRGHTDESGRSSGGVDITDDGGQI